MTANDLIAAFETLADAPDGVKRLRELVLRLAVRGKLVAQLPTDIPPAARASDTAALKRDNLWKLSSIDALPSTWRIVPFANLGQWGSGGTPLKGHPEYYDGDIPWLKIGDLNDGLVTTAETTISMEGLANSAAKMVPPGVLLVAMYGSIGKSGITGIRCCTNQAIAHCIPDLALVTLQYVFRLVGAMRHDLEMQGKGAAQQNISQTVLRHLLVPLPPLAEQHRIVTRVDELMGLLDRLEAARTARDDVRRAARDAALAALRDAEDTDAVEAAWGRIAGQMEALFAEPEDVGPLRQAVLGLAVRGRLVSQDPKDEPARSVLKKLKSEADRLVQAKAIRRPAPLPAVGAADRVFIVPDAWEWARLQDVGDWGAGATPLRGDSRYFGGSVNWFKSGELPDGSMRAESEERITQAALAECSLRQNQPGDVLIAMYGATIGKLGILEVPGTTNQAVCACTCFSGFSNRYLFLVLLAWREAFRASGEGGAQPNISKVKIVTTAIPVPPLAEQHRIVAKVDALMAICDALEARLTTARDLHGQFAAAAVHHLDV
jgi:type I restriction enzyme S subunit